MDRINGWVILNGEWIPTNEVFWAQIKALSCRIDRLSVQMKVLYGISIFEFILLLITH